MSRFAPRPQPQAQPLRIVAHGFSQRNYAMLAQLFSSRGWSDCALVGKGEADLGIVDLDTPAPDRTWQEYRRCHPDVPAIVLSLCEQRRESAQCLRKPVDAATLRNAIDVMRERNAAAAPGVLAVHAASQVRSTPRRAAAPRATAANTGSAGAHSAAAQLDREIDEGNCGTAADVDLDDADAVAAVTYDPARYFQGALEQALAAVRRSGLPHEIRGLLPAPLRIVRGPPPRVATALRPALLRTLSAMQLRNGSVAIACSRAAPATGASMTDAVALLWQVALWTARGRLRSGLTPTMHLRLKKWPDLTRLAETPHAMRIAAVLVCAPHSPRELCERLRIPQRYVFSFLSAAATTPDLEVAARDASAAAAPPAAHTPLRELFARILGRLGHELP